MRDIKFRGKGKNINEWVYGYLLGTEFQKWIAEGFYKTHYEVIPETVGQYTGLKDKNEKDIYTGDTIRWRVPYRTTQTHYGDNIPNGAYTEPLEPGIKIKEGNIEFRDGIFGVDSEDGPNDLFCPLLWDIQTWDEIGIQEAISCRKDFWDNPEEGDLQYLLEEFNLENLQALIDLLSGVEVIGNIYEPEP